MLLVFFSVFSPAFASDLFIFFFWTKVEEREMYILKLWACSRSSMHSPNLFPFISEYILLCIKNNNRKRNKISKIR